MGQVGWPLFGFFWRGVAFIQAMWGCECFFRTNVWRQCGLENIPLSRLSDPQSDIHFRFIQLGLIFIYKSRASVYVRVKYWMYITRPRSTLLHLIISQQRMRLTTTYTINLYPDGDRTKLLTYTNFYVEVLTQFRIKLLHVEVLTNFRIKLLQVEVLAIFPDKTSTLTKLIKKSPTIKTDFENIIFTTCECSSF